MTTRILVGDCRERMAELDAESVDSIVTDPPYELGFMGKSWDRSGIAFDPETWAACLRVLKPGGHLLAFGGTRTVHRIATAIEDAGFEIRDQIAWLYGSGFPKSHNLDGEWEGWGTALKPAMEPVIVARKSLIGTVAANVAEHGTGAFNVDGCRIETEARPVMVRTSTVVAARAMAGESTGATPSGEMTTLGRWPANVVLDEAAAAMLDAQTGELTSGFMAAGTKREGIGYHGGLGVEVRNDTHGDSGGASRFFYTAKASQSERTIGGAESIHPTVKPISLMRWLVRLVTPPGGTVLDPFCGSGTTGIASDREGFHSILIDITPEYAEISRKRITGDAPMFADVEVA